MNRIVNPKLHMGLPFYSDGYSKQVILPIDLCHLEVSVQRIAAKSNVVSDPTHLILKNEGCKCLD